jgi:PAS domain S-box-containing protein
VNFWNFIIQNDLTQILIQLKEKNYFQGEIRSLNKYQNIISLDLIMLDVKRLDFNLGIIRDITEKRSVEKRLRESEAKYRALVDNIQEGLMILDVHGNIVFVNSILCKSLLYAKAELIGSNLSEFISPHHFEMIKIQIESGEFQYTGHKEVLFKAKDNTEKVFLLSMSALYDSPSRYSGTIALCIDITDLSHQTTHLADMRGMLLRMILSETTERLLIAQGWLDILDSEISIPEHRYRLEKVMTEIEKLVLLNHQITEFTKLKSIYKIPFVLIPISDFKNDLKKLLSPFVPVASIQIDYRIPKSQLIRFKIPDVLTIGIEQIVRYSLKRKSSKIEISIKEIPDNNLQIQIVDNGKVFLETIESPETSKFLMNIILTDVLMKKIGGKVSITNILPKDGLQVSLTVPLDSKLINSLD